MFGIGMQELLIILVIVVVVFGANKLPQLGDGFGKMITNFRKSTRDPENPEKPAQGGDSKTISQG
jgi:sec-independent protein translocase protein TatA